MPDYDEWKLSYPPEWDDEDEPDDEESSKGMVEYWDKERPDYEHVLIVSQEFYPIPDHLFLANVQRGNKDGS